MDFLTKAFKKNEGEIPQYYVEESHPAIIDPYEWEQVQIERNIRNETKTKSHKSSILCSRIFCEECGSAYGLKVWHSNDKGRKLVWQCNNKYKNKDNFCSTPHIDDKRVKEMFIDVFNQVFKAKASLINDFELVKDKLFTPINQEALKDLQQELEIVSELIKCHVESGTKDYSDSYLAEYDKLVARYKDVEKSTIQLSK